MPSVMDLTRQRDSLIALAVLLATLATISGCSRDDADSRVAAMNDSNIRRVANLYNAFQLRKGMQGPKDEAEFRHFIQREMPPIKLKRMLVDPNNVDELFVSERDRQPFVIRYGVNGGLGTVDPVVFEKDGVDGKRQVAFTGGSIEAVDNSRYEQLTKRSPMRGGAKP